MITPADVLDVMTVITAYHHRTAPRQDDPEVAYATAKLWAELFERYDFTPAELIAAVKYRADTCADAPEPADIIRVARTARSDRMAREPLPQHRSDDEPENYPGDAKAAPDIAEYPTHWDSELRVAAYWYAMKLLNSKPSQLEHMPRTTAAWRAIANQLEDERTKRAQETPR